MSYENFLANKMPAMTLDGVFDAKLPKALKPFQAAATRWALARRKSALFAGTGLGKTLKQLCWAQEISKREDAPILILTPLAVAHQTVKEAEKFDIKGASYAAENPKRLSPITITNYDRVDKFNPNNFAGIVLDESSIIKHEDSKTRKMLGEMFAKTPWKLCCTATPSPNDYIEIGSHSEFLGIMDAAEMLAMYFVHEGAIRAGGAVEDWRLKRHAEKEFWKWVSSWALVYNSPKDLGFEEKGYELPELRRKLIEVEFEREVPQGRFYPSTTMTLSERIKTRAATVSLRSEAAANLINSDPKASWLVWCGRNDEASELEKRIKGALQVSGSMDRDLKQERLLGFVEKKPRVLITKPSIAGFGMNWQHCHKMVFVGLNDSFEQLYQAMRRCWRFGQIHPVEVYIISSTAEYAVLQNVMQKEQKLNKLYTSVSAFSRESLALKPEQTKKINITSFSAKELPQWLR